MSVTTHSQGARFSQGEYLAVNQQFEEGNGLLRAILIHARHVEVVQEDHEALAHRRPICILGAFLCAILQHQKAMLTRAQ